ncbi:hypothetical protein LXL04_005422 [Taraxacum kok-saghyz]
MPLKSEDPIANRERGIQNSILEKRSLGAGRSRWYENRRKGGVDGWNTVNMRARKNLEEQGAKWSFTDATNIFISNLPEVLDSQMLREKLNSLGTMVDLIIANRRDKHGYKFGFVRYNRVEDLNQFIGRLNRVKINGRNLFAKEASFKRKEKKMTEVNKINGNPRPSRSFINPVVRKGSIYAEAVTGQTGSSKEPISQHPETFRFKTREIKIAIEEGMDRAKDLKSRFIGEAKVAFVFRLEVLLATFVCAVQMARRRRGVADRADNETSARPLLGADPDQCLQTSSHFLNTKNSGRSLSPSRFSPIKRCSSPIFLHHRSLLIAGSSATLLADEFMNLRRVTVRPSLDADEFMNLLHGSDPVKVELNRLENEVRYKYRELGEAQAEIKALRLSERLREKAVEEVRPYNLPQSAKVKKSLELLIQEKMQLGHFKFNLWFDEGVFPNPQFFSSIDKFI